MTGNYDFHGWETCAIVPWEISAKCKRCGVLQNILERRNSLDHYQVEQMENCQQYVQDFVHRFEDLRNCKFFSYQHNVTALHFQLLIAVNPWYTALEHFDELDEGHEVHVRGYFCLDSMGKSNGDNTIPTDCGFMWFLNYAFSSVSYTHLTLPTILLV